MKNLSALCAENGYYENLKVKKVRVRAIWLMHGAIAAPVSFLTGVASANSLTHWWVEIETEECSDVWFCAQFAGKMLVLSEHASLSQVTEAGKSAAGREEEDVEITNKLVFRPDATMGEIYRWMDNYDDDYDLVFNNCQTFGDRFSAHFGGQNASNTQAVTTGILTAVSVAALVHGARTGNIAVSSGSHAHRAHSPNRSTNEERGISIEVSVPCNIL